MSRIRGTALVATAALSIASLACAGRGSQVIVVITLDTVRADHLGCYGSRRGLTPNLDRLAARSVLFEDASCAVPLTLPSHASLFTGRYPTATGVRNNGSYVLPASETTLAEVLSARGFRTGAVVGAFPLSKRFGLAQGFDIYDDEMPRRAARDGQAFSVHFDERNAAAVTDRAIAVWERLGSAPRFLWVHYFDAHAPYAAPEPWGSEHSERPYEGEIAYVDAQLGRLLARLGRDAPQAVIVVAADHGESLGEHGEKTHGVFVYQSTIHVPLLISAPGLWPEGKRVTEPVSLVDVAPTLLALARVRARGGVDGVDLGPAVEGAKRASREVYAESYLPLLQFRFSALTMLRDGPLKYVDAPAVELYDLARDPGETRNLAGTGLPAEAPLASRLAALGSRADPSASTRAAGGLDGESAARLASLGYASGGPPAAAPRRGRGPKTMTGDPERDGPRVRLQAGGKTHEGAALLRTLIPEAPENYMVHFQLAAGLVARGDLSGAKSELAQVVADAPEFANARWMLGDCLAALGELDEAAASYDAAAAQLPGQAGPWIAKGRALEARGRFDAAADTYRAALDADPSSLEAARALLTLRQGRGDLPRAIEELDALRARYSKSTSLTIALAEARLRSGDSNEAVSGFRSALAAEPDSRAAGLGLARALAAGSPSDRLEAETRASALAERYPRDPAPRLLLGQLAEKRGDGVAALAAYREVLTIDPGNVDGVRGASRVAAGALKLP